MLNGPDDKPTAADAPPPRPDQRAPEPPPTLNRRGLLAGTPLAVLGGMTVAGASARTARAADQGAGLLPALGLDDPATLAEAHQLAPEIFASLRLAAQAKDAVFPLETIEALEELLGPTGTFRSEGVFFTVKDLKQSFPHELLPVRDRHDLLRKAYLTITAAHEVAGEAGRAAALKSPSAPEALKQFLKNGGL